MKVLVADERARVRHALRVLLERQPGIQVIGEAIDADNLANQVHSYCPDLLLLDWGLPGLLGALSLSALRKACPDIVIVALSGRPELRQEALQAGADAFITKTESPTQLLGVIQACCP